MGIRYSPVYVDTVDFVTILGNNMFKFSLMIDEPVTVSSIPRTILEHSYFLASMSKDGVLDKILKDKRPNNGGVGAWHIAHTVHLFGKDLGLIKDFEVKPE